MTKEYITKLIELVSDLEEAAKINLNWQTTDEAAILEKIIYLAGYIKALNIEL